MRLFTYFNMMVALFTLSGEHEFPEPWMGPTLWLFMSLWFAMSLNTLIDLDNKE